MIDCSRWIGNRNICSRINPNIVRMSEIACPDETSIDWFREASPYISAHRGSTLVMAVPGSILRRTEVLATLTEDIALLQRLGLRLVLCIGLRAQLDEALGTEGLIVDGRRVTDDTALERIIVAAGRARIELEARLSRGLPNTPMAGTRTHLSSGNFLTAQPFGIHDGVDFQHTGAVRAVDHAAVNALLDAGHVVLLPPIGYSLTGELFNLALDDVASSVALALGADKLVLFSDQMLLDAEGTLVRQLSVDQLDSMTGSMTEAATPAFRCTLEYATRALDGGVPRVHILSPENRNALLAELFTTDGAGTLLTAERWTQIRAASIDDVGGIIELVTPLQQNGVLVTRSREELELDVERFQVIERDGRIIACGALFFDAAGDAEIASIATHPLYRGKGHADELMHHLEQLAQSRGAQKARVLSTRTGHWFIARGYREVGIDALSAERRESYNRQRNSKVFEKQL